MLRLKTYVDLVCVLLIVVFSGILFFAYLGSGPLWAADEQTYSQWGFYMVKTDDYLNPWVFGSQSLWVGKPPLYFWLMAFSYQTFGINNFSTRFWSPVFGVLSCVVIFFIGKLLYNRTVGLLSALVLSTFFSFFSFARHAMLDVPLVFFMLGSIFFFFLGEKSEKTKQFASLSGLFFGLALLTKQTTALLIPLIFGFYLVATRKSLRTLFTKRFTILIGVGILVTAPWLLYMAFQFGPQFWYVYFVYNNVARATMPLEGHVGGVLFYFQYLVNSENWLWVAILPFAFGLSAYKAIRNRNNGDVLIVIWAIAVFGVFTFVQTKLFWYILPAFPAFALAIASFLDFAFRKIKTRRLRRS